LALFGRGSPLIRIASAAPSTTPDRRVRSPPLSGHRALALRRARHVTAAGRDQSMSGFRGSLCSIRSS
jgi:hypothetical protein